MEAASSEDCDSSDDEPRRRGQQRRQRRRRVVAVPADPPRRQRRKTIIKDLELATFKPSPTVSESTLIAKVDSALEGTRVSDQGEWTDEELYYILSNKLQDTPQGSGSRWTKNCPGANVDNVEDGLTTTIRERPDKSAAEWRVSRRRMMPGETYVDFAAGLRDLTGQNQVSERILLAQFYRSLDKNDTATGEATTETTEARRSRGQGDRDRRSHRQCRTRNAQHWTGLVNGPKHISDVGSGVGAMEEGNGMVRTDGEDLAYFTNPQGVWNKYTGTWEYLKDERRTGATGSSTRKHRSNALHQEHKLVSSEQWEA
ncbi:hypothetical protein L916_21591 [Phytophthora nicotianae]|uniref:Retrotransposon gag domain-containing protein n=1 Tax=Phytophthora nicotianae TaxID=4792 RepID=W2HQX5_PHYNI|nr:hypothetical protein L916_21591 [Phytophthora nicotianae]